MAHILYTGGTFDLFHAGHVNFLMMCKTLAGESGIVVVSLNSDEFIERYKGYRPIISFEDRKTILESCRFVDKVVRNNGDEDSKVSIEEVKPTIVAIGSDWAKKDYYSQMKFSQRWLDDRKIILVYLPYKDGVSSTTIKERVFDASSI